MMNGLYKEDIKHIANLDLPWDMISNKAILISGATGMIGSCLIDALMYKNTNDNLNCHIYAIGRNFSRAKEVFNEYIDDNNFVFIEHDVKNDLNLDVRIDYVLQLASNTHPLQYSTKPIETIVTNVLGTKNLLEYAVIKKATRFLFASSVEVYGENNGLEEKFSESYSGYIDCNNARAGYPESKRCAEALCQSYKSEKNLDIVIARFSRLYGPTMKLDDTKALSQFIIKAVDNEDIILKSDGNQLYSYCYVADAVSGLLTILLKGQNGEAYNVADYHLNLSLKELANICANYNGKKVIYEIPEKTEKEGYSKVKKALLDTTKLQNLGWSSNNDTENGVNKTISIIKDRKR